MRRSFCEQKSRTVLELNDRMKNLIDKRADILNTEQPAF